MKSFVVNFFFFLWFPNTVHLISPNQLSLPINETAMTLQLFDSVPKQIKDIPINIQNNKTHSLSLPLPFSLKLKQRHTVEPCATSMLCAWPHTHTPHHKVRIPSTNKNTTKKRKQKRT